MLKQLGRDIAVYGSGDLLFRIVGFLVFPIYAHVFSLSEFGVLALVTSSAGVVALFAGPGLNMAITRYYWDPATTADIRPSFVLTGLATQIAWSTGVVLLVVACLFPAREWVATRYAANWAIVVMALAVIIPDQILQYCLSVLRLQFSPWKFTLVSFLKNIVSVAVGLALVLFLDTGLEGLFAGGLAGTLFGAAIAVALIRSEFGGGFRMHTARRFLSYGYPFVFAGLAYLIFGTVDRWMLAEMSDTTELGLYAIAFKFAGVLVFVNSAFGQAWSPIALKLMHDEASYRSAYSRVLSSWFFLLTIGGSAIALFGEEALRLLTPSSYWPAAPVIAPLIMGIVLFGTTQITAIGISLENKTRLFATGAWTAALTNILLNFALIPLLGALGAALATFLSYALLTSFYLFWSQKLHPIPLEKGKLVYTAALALGITVLPILAGSSTEWSVLAVILKLALLGAMVFGGFFFGIIDTSILRKSFGKVCSRGPKGA